VAGVVRILQWFFLGAIALYASVCLLAFLVQRKLLYFPARYTEQAALNAGERMGLHPWRDGRGTLAGWCALPATKPIARVVVLHGNAGSALDRLNYASAFVGLGVEVVLLEYPGYGSLPGPISLRALSDAAAQALDQLAAQGREPIWLLGESLGSGVAARAAARRPDLVRGLVLVTPFARLSDVVRAHYPFLPPFLLLDRFVPEDDLASYRGPAVVIVAGQDEVVGIDQGRRLFAKLHGPKRLVVEEQATHNDLNLERGTALWPDVVAFLASGEQALVQ